MDKNYTFKAPLAVEVSATRRKSLGMSGLAFLEQGQYARLFPQTGNYVYSVDVYIVTDDQDSNYA